jgi:SNF family Na+-dependent transporter
VLEKMAYGQVFGFLWFFLLFVAGVTSSISLAQPAIAFLEDEFNLSRREAAVLFAVITFLLCQPVIFFYGNGVLGEMDFWGTTVCLVVFATVEVILFAWVFGIDRAWTELHAGSDIRIPSIYRFIIKYITPLMLLTILASWIWTDWRRHLFLEDIPPADKPIILLTRVGLAGLFIFLLLMVRFVWRRRPVAAAQEIDP